MKAFLTVILLFVLSSGFIQAQNMTTFIGEIKSSEKVVKNQRLEQSQSIETVIEFTVRTIKIGDDTYNIVSKQFDGNKTSTFRCSKGRGQFVITFVADEYISVEDQRTPGIETRYSELEKL